MRGCRNANRYLPPKHYSRLVPCTKPGGVGRLAALWTDLKRPNRLTTPPVPAPPPVSALLAGVACGIGAAVFWAAAFVSALHGLAVGLVPADLVFHRYVWAGLIFVPFFARGGFSNLGGVSWTRAIVLTIFV